MTGSIIRIDQPSGAGAGVAGNARIGIWADQEVQLVSTASGNVSQLWEFVDKPPTSTAVIATPTSVTGTFNPDVPGTYLIRLTTNGGGPNNVQIRVCGVTLDSLGAPVNREWRPPGFFERAENTTGLSTRGWATALEFIFYDILSFMASPVVGGNILIYKQGAVSSGNLYGTKAELDVAFAALVGPAEIVVDDTTTTPSLFTTSSNYERRTLLRGTRSVGGPRTQLTVTTDATITDVLQFANLLLSTTNTGAPAFTSVGGINIYLDNVFARSESTGRLFTFLDESKLWLFNGSKLRSNVGAAAHFSATTDCEIHVLPGCEIESNTLTGSGALTVYNYGGTVSTLQTGFTGTITYYSAAISPGAADTVFRTNSAGSAVEFAKLVDANIDGAAAIVVTKIAPGVGDTVVRTNAGGTALEHSKIVNDNVHNAAAITVTKLSPGSANTVVRTNSGGSALEHAQLVNANIDAAAAISGTKINPDFGAQNVTTTGNVSCDDLVLAGSVKVSTDTRLQPRVVNSGSWEQLGNIWTYKRSLSLIAGLGTTELLGVVTPSAFLRLTKSSVRLLTDIVGGTATLTLGITTGGTEILASWVWTSANTSSPPTPDYRYNKTGHAGTDLDATEGYEMRFTAVETLSLQLVVTGSAITTGSVMLYLEMSEW